MLTYKQQLSVMPKDDLALELEMLRARFSWFMMADRSFRDPRETQRRLETEAMLRDVHEEINRRKSLGKLALAKLETSNWLRRTINTLSTKIKLMRRKGNDRKENINC